jgi:hypothetical protein
VPSIEKAFWLIADAGGHVELKARTARPSWAWMVFEAPFQVRPSHFFGIYTTILALCDFASAGNAWSETNIYRTWLPQPLFLSEAFPANTWKLMYPEIARPTIPAAIMR